MLHDEIGRRILVQFDEAVRAFNGIAHEIGAGRWTRYPIPSGGATGSCLDDTRMLSNTGYWVIPAIMICARLEGMAGMVPGSADSKSGSDEAITSMRKPLGKCSRSQ